MHKRSRNETWVLQMFEFLLLWFLRPACIFALLVIQLFNYFIVYQGLHSITFFKMKRQGVTMLPKLNPDSCSSDHPASGPWVVGTCVNNSYLLFCLIYFELGFFVTKIILINSRLEYERSIRMGGHACKMTIRSYCGQKESFLVILIRCLCWLSQTTFLVSFY